MSADSTKGVIGYLDLPGPGDIILRRAVVEQARALLKDREPNEPHDAEPWLRWWQQRCATLAALDAALNGGRRG